MRDVGIKNMDDKVKNHSDDSGCPKSSKLLCWIKASLGRFTKGYNRVMASSLNFRGLHTYYERPEKFLKEMNKRYWHLSPRELKRMHRTSPCAYLGREAIEGIARRRLKFHARNAAFVTFLCALATGWMIWPMMLVDIIFFQREIFRFTQEVVILAKPKREYGEKNEFVFNYTNLAMLMIKLTESFGVRQLKKGTGRLGKFIVKRGSRFFRGPIQVAVRQALKWLGISVGKDVIEQGIDCAVVVICACLAGLITYWLFMPMMRRVNMLLESDDETI